MTNHPESKAVDKIYYKVIRVCDDERVSAIADKFKIDYPKDKWVFPIVGKLFVFDNKETARKFAISNFAMVDGKYPPPDLNNRRRLFSLKTAWSAAEVVPCKVVNPEIAHSIANFSLTFITNEIEELLKRFWDDKIYLHKRQILFTRPAPTGTFVVDAIRCLK